MATLVTFPGKFGDILWALPTVRELSRTDSVDLAVMPKFVGVLELVSRQPYVNNCYCIPGWEMENDWCGAQPMMPPEGSRLPREYGTIVNLGYPRRPDLPLVQYTASRAGVTLGTPVLPFLKEDRPRSSRLVTYAFNDMHVGAKMAALLHLKGKLPQLDFQDVSTARFEDAARLIDSSLFFLGCRSACYVIAHGLSKRILTVEPDIGRRGHIFSCPWGREALPQPEDHATMVRIAREWAA